MIIILEGTERTGKTTFAKALEKEGFINFKDNVHTYNMQLNSYGTTTMDNRVDAVINMLSKLDEAGINVVVDRLHISNLVFSVNYRNNEPSKIFGFVDAILSKMNTKLYLFERFDEGYYTSHPVFGKKDSSKEKLSKLQDDFRYYFDKSEIKIKKQINIAETDMNLLIDEAIERNILSEIEDNWHPEFEYDFYLASPFFNEVQKEREKAVKQVLRSHGLKVYAPFEHGTVKSDATSNFCKEVFDSNIQAIQKCRYVLAITDEKDMGTIWEAGYAYGIGKPVIYYAETLGKNPFNIMLSESGYGIFRDRITLGIALENNKLNYKEEVNHE